MIHTAVSFRLVIIGIIISQYGLSQGLPAENNNNIKTGHIISGVHTLSVHVRDSRSHDSVFNFFVNKLMLPVYYTPVVYGQKNYAGVYAGNMVLEPCGPYQNIDYATDDFRAIFYGLNFEVKSLSSSAIALHDRGINCQVNKGSVYITDSVLCNDNIFTALYEVNDKEIRDSLQNSLLAYGIDNPGIEYIKEIMIAYKEEVNLLKWMKYLHPLKFSPYYDCSINDSLQIHFTRANYNKVLGITFKVKSLAATKQYLTKNLFLISESDHKIKLNEIHSFGLSMYFTDTK